MDFLNIIGLIVGIAGIVYAVVKDKHHESERKKLVSKFEQEREIDQERYEEEKQRAIEAQKQADEDRRARQEQVAREEQFREQQRLTKQREIEAEQNYRESDRRFKRMDGARTRFNPKEVGWDAHITDGGVNIEITNLTDRAYSLVTFKEARPDDLHLIDPPFGEIRGLGAKGSVKISRYRGFDNVEAVFVEAYSDKSYPVEVKIPLDPSEAMPEYRAA